MIQNIHTYFFYNKLDLGASSILSMHWNTNANFAQLGIEGKSVCGILVAAGGSSVNSSTQLYNSMRVNPAW